MEQVREFLWVYDGTEARGPCILFPQGYERGTTQRFPVLLVIGSDLNAVSTVNTLHTEGVLPPMIIVEADDHGFQSDPVHILNAISARCGILENPEARWIVGTGHSAVMAMNAVLDHPEIFGKGACLSTSFEGIEGAPPLHSPVLQSLEERTVFPRVARLLFDYGTVGLDECYEPYHRDLGAILRNKGWQEGREFQITRSPGGSHAPASWGARLGPALRWLASH
jgi:hypothetical protein